MDNPLRLNNFAMGLRELSRIVLHDVAPDEIATHYQVDGCNIDNSSS